MHQLCSAQHPLVKHWVKLRESRAYRYQHQRVLLSGVKVIHELALQQPFYSLIVEEGYPLPPLLKGKSVYRVPLAVLKKITGLVTPEPLAVEITMLPQPNLCTLSSLLILDRIADPGNLGTLFRTALALGWQGAFLTAGSVDPYNEKALRAAKGATFLLPWRCGSDAELSTLLQQGRFTLFAADPRGRDFTTIPLPTPPFALALGNEAHGLKSSVAKGAIPIGIPMTGMMESLNVASSGAILMALLGRVVEGSLSIESIKTTGSNSSVEGVY